MKKLILLALIIIFTACNGNVSFPLTQHIEEQTVKGILLNIKGDGCNFSGAEKLFNILTEPISIDIENSQEFKQQAPKQITGIILDKVVLKITDTMKASSDDIDNFDFLNSIKIVAEYPNDSSKSVVIGELDEVPQGVTEITISGNGANIADFFDGTKFKITTKTDGHPPCDNESFDGDITLVIEGKLF